VQPRARRTGVVGLVDGADGPRLKLAVNATPADGQANRAVCAMMAAVLGVPASTVTIAQGGAARDKVLSIAGAPALLGPRLEALA
jgi:uncharacterized protein YggU (UPF0235/DUF167 family)